ncbi:MAG: phosphoglucosamine mutase [Euryarchaeota archaeon RBG_16_68_12]|nr:MAG: phosphoglucosamine mutase [Euryarchaeota archaeon RBG_16_68_12]
MRWFGSSGIRGIANVEVTADLAMAVGRVLGSSYGGTIVGRDPRLTGEMLASALMAGIQASGADATDAGMVSTPTLARGAKDYKCGAVVTASHNPAPYNGIKLWNPDGVAFDEVQQEEIEAALERKAFGHAAWDRVGTRRSRSDLVERHRESILSAVGRAELKVVVDCGSGATSTITPGVLQEMGCKVVALNAHPDGHFPGRDPEPTEENLRLLRDVVRAAGAALGIAHDGDGDRMVAVDEHGEFVGGDKLLAVFAKREVRKAVVVPVDTSMAIDEMLPAAKVVRTRVGDVYVAQEVRRHKADFGGEPSGTWIFPKVTLCPDGVYAAAHLVSLVAETPLSRLVAAVPSYPLLRGAVPFTTPRGDVAGKLDAAIASMGRPVEKVDGWRVAFDDGWFLVRLSGTEPKVRVTAEARTEARAKELYELALSKVRAAA